MMDIEYTIILISVSFIWYLVLARLIKAKKIKYNNKLNITIPLLIVLTITNIFLNIKYNTNILFNTQLLVSKFVTIFHYIILAAIAPIYYLLLKNNLLIPQKINRVLSIISILMFLRIVFLSGIKSILIPLIYLIFEFINSNNFKNIKTKKIKFNISHIDCYQKLSPTEKEQYIDFLIKSITVFWAMIALTMITVSDKGFIYQCIFISFISFTFIRNIKTNNFKKFLTKKNKSK